METALKENLFPEQYNKLPLLFLTIPETLFTYLFPTTYWQNCLEVTLLGEIIFHKIKYFF